MLRINRCIQLSRLEIYIGRRPHWPSSWDAWPTDHGYQARVGRWEFIGEWLPLLKVRRAREQLRMTRELFAAISERTGRHYRVRPLRSS
jgi:hypothetical protein